MTDIITECVRRMYEARELLRNPKQRMDWDKVTQETRDNERRIWLASVAPMLKLKPINEAPMDKHVLAKGFSHFLFIVGRELLPKDKWLCTTDDLAAIAKAIKEAGL